MKTGKNQTATVKKTQYPFQKGKPVQSQPKIEGKRSQNGVFSVRTSLSIEQKDFTKKGIPGQKIILMLIQKGIPNLQRKRRTQNKKGHSNRK